jgi:hypothetical protein
LLKTLGLIFALLFMLLVAALRLRLLRWMKPDLLPQITPGEITAGRFALIGGSATWIVAMLFLAALLLIPGVRENQSLFIALDGIGIFSLIASLLLQWASWPVAGEAERAAEAAEQELRARAAGERQRKVRREGVDELKVDAAGAPVETAQTEGRDFTAQASSDDLKPAEAEEQDHSVPAAAEAAADGCGRQP